MRHFHLTWRADRVSPELKLPSGHCCGDAACGDRRRRPSPIPRTAPPARPGRLGGGRDLLLPVVRNRRAGTAPGSTGSRTTTRRRRDRVGLVPGARPVLVVRAGVVRSQMREIASIGVQTVIVSWWGEGSPRPRGCRSSRGPRVPPASGSRCTSSRSPAAPRDAGAALRAFAASGITDAYIYDSTTTPTRSGRR